MATVHPLPSTPCQFERSWVGKCGKPTTNGWCDEHQNATCCVCGKQATRDCEAGMGGLTCGAYLCETCTHTEDRHVTVEEYARMREEKNSEKEVIKSSRTDPAQRLVDGVPANLFELLKNPDGFALSKLYYLELDHTLMAFFPAIIYEGKRIIISTDREFIKEVWKLLEPRQSKMSELVGYAGSGVAYGRAQGSQVEKEDAKPIRMLTPEELKDLIVASTDENPTFGWARGLLGADHMTPDSFLRLITLA